jgi:hypothetical protein
VLTYWAFKFGKQLLSCSCTSSVPVTFSYNCLLVYNRMANHQSVCWYEFVLFGQRSKKWNPYKFKTSLMFFSKTVENIQPPIYVETRMNLMVPLLLIEKQLVDTNFSRHSHDPGHLVHTATPCCVTTCLSVKWFAPKRRRTVLIMPDIN